MSNPRVQTVLGDVRPEQLGLTLPHEHLASGFTQFYRKPPKAIAHRFDSYCREHLGFIRQYPYSSKFNLTLDNSSSLIQEVDYFKQNGGCTIVENSTEGLERDLEISKVISQKTGVHIVASTGFYIADMQAADLLISTSEDLYLHMLKELTEGCKEEPEIRAGFMGEIASVWPIRDFELRAIKAAAEVQPQLGCGVSFHPHREAKAPFEIVRLYLEAGGSANKLVMSHLDRTILDPEKLMEFAELGVYCQFDQFGVETVSYYQLELDTGMPSDAQRIELIKNLVAEGKEDRILISHDIHTKHRLVEYGGHGYSHIITNILPRMKAKGISQEIINKITIENPARWLTINKDF